MSMPDATGPLALECGDDGVAVLTFNRPASLNAFDAELRQRFADALAAIERDRGIRALVLTGAGRAFCAGADVGEMPARLAVPPGAIGVDGWRRLRVSQQSILRLHGLPIPTLAAVNGAAAGLGCDIALACDFIVAGEAARFGMSFVHRALVPDGGGMYFLPRRVGLARAKALVFSGDMVDAHEALRIGLADRVAPSGALLDDARRWAGELAGRPPAAIGLAKSLLDASFETTLEQSLAASAQAQAICYGTGDHRASVQAFLDRAGKGR
ncbi:crotonase/enoyl-CoA hydratase family protein [Pigmentiphaga soli]|uniref:Crotonase/enoyl-CoA hydratase family protein n=1 Tax=Pigmentiphaga soli TaxID=1007095 RepID=A0ABP8GEJ8_9BURK